MVVAAVGLVLAIAGAGSPGLRTGRPLGLVQPPNRVSSSARTSADNLSYQNGPVMRSSSVYTIFWAPDGYAFPDGYEALVNRFFTDVAADSGTSSNFYSVLTQYSDDTGSIAYDSTFAGTADDTQAYPASGCTLPSDVDGGASMECLTEDQEAAEVKRFADAQGWPHGPNVEFFLYTPHGVGSCYTDAATECSYDVYCAYHSWLFDEADAEYLWANEPYPMQSLDAGARASACDTGQWPNSADTSNPDDNAADVVVESTGHEYSETVTDPLATGWVIEEPDSAYAGDEIADICSYEWFYHPVNVLGGSFADNTAYDQVINGHPYWLQGNWSNSTATNENWSGCVTTGRPTVTWPGSEPQVGNTLSGSAGVWPWTPFDAHAFTFTWLRCDPSGKKCQKVTTATQTQNSSTYTIQKADYAHTIELSVSETDDGSPLAPIVSDPTATIGGAPEVGFPPSISGAAVVGNTLSGDLGFWGVGIYPITSYAYSWIRCDDAGANCSKVRGGTTKTRFTTLSYKLTPADDRKTLALEVTATNAVATSAPADSFLTDIVGGEPEGGSPSLTGTPTVGNSLTANLDPAGWSYPPTAFKVVWTRTVGVKTTTIRTSTVKPGAAAPVYKLTAADDRARIGISVTASNAAGSSDPATASAGPVDGEPLSTAAPSLTGTAKVGLVLTGGAGTWSPAATKYRYEWLRCDALGDNCTVVATVTSPAASVTRKSVVADAGKTLRLRVTASNAAGSSVPVTTAATAVVAS
jgi:hypothetical protein